MEMIAISVASRKGASNDIALRDSLFPGAANRLWQHQAHGGFVSIPKTLPFIARILDEITKGAPVGKVYSVLWTFVWSNDAFVKMGRARDIAYACGFTGARGVRTLNDRLAVLRDLGMIEAAPGADGDISFVYIPSPHYSLLKLWVDKKHKIQDRSFNAFRERATNMGARDVKEMLTVINAGGILSPITVSAPPASAIPPAVFVGTTGFAVSTPATAAPAPTVGLPMPSTAPSVPVAPTTTPSMTPGES
jgi:hypothetical protein